MIDTHSHIQFKIFDQNRAEVIKQALEAGVEKIIAVGTDVESSKKAVAVAEKYSSVYAAVGIHPHHVFAFVERSDPSTSFHEVIRVETSLNLFQDKSSHSREILHSVQENLSSLMHHPKVVAIGETGLDAHHYPSTKYPNYEISEEFLKLQEKVFIAQIKLAIQYQKTLIIHNRGMADQLLEIFIKQWDPFLSRRAVFHCCEPNKKMLDFAKKHQVFIGVDGDITYDKDKQSFIQQVPLELLVLETDSPFFIPDPLKSSGDKINTPANLPIIAEFINKLMGQNVQLMSRNNASVLFKL
jgi:TatD DNase family protein